MSQLGMVLSYGVWQKIGEFCTFKQTIGTGLQTQPTAYDLNLALFPPTEFDIAGTFKRISSTSMTPWLRVTESTWESKYPGYPTVCGLYALMTFMRGHIITVYVGRDIGGAKKASEFSLTYKGHTIDGLSLIHISEPTRPY